ncbi:MAG: hypothetical protein ACR2PJ_03775 [Pseudomonadales bacterium]
MQQDSPPINTQDPGELARMVQQVDSSLSYISDMNPEDHNFRTLLVERDGTQAVLKVRAPSNNIWDETHFYYEIHALRRTEERHMTDVVRLLGEYQSSDYHAILKSFAQGTPCNRLDHEALLLDPDFIKKLDALYLKLHLAGIARIDFQPRKLVVRDDGGLTLVDLNTCLVNTEVGTETFSHEMREDSHFITRLEKASRKAGKSAGVA